jgi:hypothetical protein
MIVEGMIGHIVPLRQSQDERIWIAFREWDHSSFIVCCILVGLLLSNLNAEPLFAYMRGESLTRPGMPQNYSRTSGRLWTGRKKRGNTAKAEDPQRATAWTGQHCERYRRCGERDLAILAQIGCTFDNEEFCYGFRPVTGLLGLVSAWVCGLAVRPSPWRNQIVFLYLVALLRPSFLP